MQDHDATSQQQQHPRTTQSDVHIARRRRAVACLVLTVACVFTSQAVPMSSAGAAWPWWWWATTTTKAPTTTVAPTTTTTAPTTTTVAPTTTTTVAPTTTTTTTTVAPTTTTTAPPSTAPCGGSLPKPTGGVWECTFADEFDGTTLDTSKWSVQTTAASGYHSGIECFVNTPNNVAVADGMLHLTVRREAAPFACTTPNAANSYSTQYTSGMVSTFGKFSQTYGRFEVRAKLPNVKVKGLQEAFWLWPENSTKYGVWPWSGEIDIAEIYHLYPDRAIPYIHYVPAVWDKNVTNNYCLIDDISKFHTYTAEWTSTTITIKYDGKVCIVDTWNPYKLAKPAPFDHPFMLALTQALGVTTNAFDPAVTPLPATTSVDYVRIWK